MRRFGLQGIRLLLAVAVPTLAAATLVIAFLESYVGVPNASMVYLTAVVATAIVAGAPGAIATSVASLLLYDFFFTEPILTLTIREPSEWLNVALLLGVGLVVGQLAALQRTRAEEARSREREARALSRVSRELATRETTTAVLPVIAGILRDETGMSRVWLALGPDSRERTVADTGQQPRRTLPAVLHVLHRAPGDEPASWVRVHQPAMARASTRSGEEAFRVRMDAGGTPLGSIWALRDRADGLPDRAETRLLAAAADQAGQALAHDALAAEARTAEIARQSDALKSALLQSVSHDLRTPLATIRAAAGSLRPGSGLSQEDQAESADAIDREVEYLNRLVTNLLDLSRIEAGALRADRDVFELDDLVGPTVERLRPRMAGRPVDIDLDAPPVEVDPVFVDDAVVNAVENALKYTPAGTRIRIAAVVLPDPAFVRLTIEDAGPGVPADALPLLFDKFYRVPGVGQGSRSGTGIGLAVVRGMIEATGGRVGARRSDLGGLAIDLDLPSAAVPPELLPGSST